MQDFFISNDEIINSIDHLTDKITSTPDNIPSFFIKLIIGSIIFQLSLFFNCSLATSSVQKNGKFHMFYKFTKKVASLTLQITEQFL